MRALSCGLSKIRMLISIPYVVGLRRILAVEREPHYKKYQTVDGATPSARYIIKQGEYMIIKDKATLEQVSKDTTVEECESLGIFPKMAIDLKESPVAGAGLAAVQIGVPIRAVYIYYKPENKDPYELRMINPIIEERIDPIIWNNEGCLSVDGSYNTDRYKQITVRWLDFDTKTERRAVFVDFFSVLVQHEINHLDGILIYKMQHRSIKIGRNDPCPDCFKEGKVIKWKKCTSHNKDS
jgi:peptide deformylase